VIVKKYKSFLIKDEFKDSYRCKPKLRISFTLYWYGWRKKSIQAIKDYLTLAKPPELPDYVRLGKVAHELAEEQVPDEVIPGKGEIKREEFFSVDLPEFGDVMISGIADVQREYEDDGERIIDCIIDYKTGSLDKARYKEQLSFYKWALEKDGAKVNNFYLMKLDLNNEETKVEVTDKMVIPELDTSQWDDTIEEMLSDLKIILYE
jgi:hypothetical protein